MNLWRGLQFELQFVGTWAVSGFAPSAGFLRVSETGEPCPADLKTPWAQGLASGGPVRRALEAEAGLRPVVSRPTVQGVLLLGAKSLPCSTPSREICASQMTPPRMAASRGGSCFLVIPQAMASLPDLSALWSRMQGSHGVNDSIIFQRSQSSPRIVCLEPTHNSPTKLLDFFLNFLTSCGSSFDWALLGLSYSEPSDAYSPYGLRAAPWGHWTDRGSLVCPG